MSGLIAVVPLRDGRTGKSRLAPGFDEVHRASLIAAMARHVIAVALGSPAIETVVVVTRDVASAEASIGSHGVTIVEQPEAMDGLNGALSLGREWAMESSGSTGMLILHADLPLLSSSDVEELADQSAELVLAADRHHVGTNALLMRWDRGDTVSLRRAEAFRFRFGEGSFVAHLAEASRVGYLPATVLQPGTELDLDTLGDWNVLPPAIRRWLDDGAIVPATCRPEVGAALTS